MPGQDFGRTLCDVLLNQTAVLLEHLLCTTSSGSAYMMMSWSQYCHMKMNYQHSSVSVRNSER